MPETLPCHLTIEGLSFEISNSVRHPAISEKEVLVWLCMPNRTTEGFDVEAIKSIFDGCRCKIIFRRKC